MAFLQRRASKLNEATRSGTFGALVKEYRANVAFTKHSENTKAAYSLYIDRLLRAYQDAPLIEMGPHDIQRRVMDANQETPGDRKSTRLNSSHSCATRMPSSA